MSVSPGVWTSDLLLHEVAALEASDRRVEAIDLLQSANVALRDPDVEQRLAELRRDAVPELDTEHIGPRPSYPDPFPGYTDLIDVPAGEATPEIVAGAVEHHGCILVRGLLEDQAVAELIADIDRSFDALHRARHGASVADTRPWYVPMAEHPDIGAFEPESRADPRWYRVCAVDSPRSMFDMIHRYTEAGIIDMVQASLGTRPVATGHKWALRRMPRRKLAFWHQEASVFDSGPLRTINVWMALSEAGGDAPGFEVVPRREREIYPTVKGFGLSNATFDEVCDRDYASPLYGPGDAMIFDEMLLHRTKSDQDMGGERYSIESWFFSPDGVPDHDRIVV